MRILWGPKLFSGGDLLNIRERQHWLVNLKIHLPEARNFIFGVI